MLHELTRPESHKKSGIRIGRGNGSGRGNYAGRGRGGQRSRSGFSRSAGFEGGQTSLMMRLPKKRGFKKYFKLQSNVQPVNLSTLSQDKRIKASDTITAEYLIELGYGNKKETFKILGSGELDKKLSFKGLACSESAKTKIEKAGGAIA